MSELTWQECINDYRTVMAAEAFMAGTNAPQDDFQPDLGQNWTVPSGYYGGYPGNFLKRIAALFPDKQHALHLFAGKVDLSQLPGDTLDIRPELSPTYCVSAETMKGVPLDQYDLIVADPPYSTEDAKHCCHATASSPSPAKRSSEYRAPLAIASASSTSSGDRRP